MSNQEYEKWIGELRSGNAPSERYQAVFSISHKREMSGLISDSDAAWLLELGRSHDPAKRACAWTLMRGISHLDSVKTFLRETWMRNDLSVDERNSLLWRCLDIEDLPLHLHESIWNWIATNREAFVLALAGYLKPLFDQGQGFASVMAESWAGAIPSKKWIYVASMVLAANTPEEQAAASAFLERAAAENGGTFLAEIEGQLRGHLAQEGKP